jgi:hypothetical protein
MGYTHGKRWSEEIIIEEVSKFVKENKMDTFPTHTEIKSCVGMEGLAAAISKHGGTKYFSEKMNLKIKECESKFGEEYELLTIKKIEELFDYRCRKTKPRYPYDIIVNDNIKIDVKVSRQFLTNCNSWQNSFNLEKIDPTCDIFVFYCLDNDGNYLKTVILPSCCVSGKNQIGIGKKSKYDDYIDAWNIISDYNKFYEKYKKID